MKTTEVRQPTLKATRECAQWLQECLKIGWDKSQLDSLEKIWWEHHDDKGELIRGLHGQSDHVSAT